MGRRLDWSNQNRSNKSPRTGISEGEIKRFKEEAQDLAKRLKAGKKTQNKTARKSGPVKVWTPEEIAAFAAERGRDV